eukprot:TRINITY_DN2491_c0_g1_i2.p1 TRINITY_DN2491_c0_g1~~TRINITY_DN2491_c0_g1_i2.p1  ORF type:complete len:937 (-),score=242.74 TRINITY_DN2491_c0_g1_i2:1200-3707(-)
MRRRQVDLWSFNDVLAEETREHLLRRRLAGVSSAVKFGVSFSGGGIRSASFHFGVLEVLARFKLAKYVDCISTVSGGGYTASAYLTHLKDLAMEDPWQEEKDIDQLHIDAVTKTKVKMLDNPCFIGNFDVPYSEKRKKSSDNTRTALLVANYAWRLLDGATSFLIFILLVPISLVYSAIVATLVGIYLSLNVSLYFGPCFVEAFSTSIPDLSKCTDEFLLYFGAKMAIAVFIWLYMILTTKFKGTILHPKGLRTSVHNAIRYCLTTTAVIFGITFAGYLISVYSTYSDLAAEITQAKILSATLYLLIACSMSAFAFKLSAVISFCYIILIIFIFLWWGYIAALALVLHSSLASSTLGTRIVAISFLLLLPILLVLYQRMKALMHRYYAWRLRKSFFAHSEDVRLNEMSCSASGAPMPYFVCSASRNNIFSARTSETFGLFSLTPKFIGAQEIQYAETHDGISLSTAVGLSAAVIAQSMGKYVAIDTISVLGGFLNISLGDWISFKPPISWKIPLLNEQFHISSIFELIYYVPLLMFLQTSTTTSWIATSFVFLLNFLSFFGNSWKCFRFLLRSVPLLTIHQALGVSFVVDDAKDELKSEQKGKYCLAPAEPLYPPLVFVSDGGHFENLGLLELIRRRCSVILSGDDGFDPDGRSDSFFYALDLARREGVDFMVPAHSPHAQMSVGKRIRMFCANSEPYLHLKVMYPDSMSSLGVDLATKADLFYIKAKRNPEDREYGTWNWRRGGIWCECCHTNSVDLRSKRGLEKPSKCTCFFNVFPFHSTAIQFFSQSMMLNYMNLGKTQAIPACKEIERLMFSTSKSFNPKVMSSPPRSTQN